MDEKKTIPSDFYKLSKKNQNLVLDFIEALLPPDEEESQKDLLSTKEVADLIGVSVPTVITMINTGRLKATKITARNYKVYRESVDRLMSR